jgi:hypothetical protein
VVERSADRLGADDGLAEIHVIYGCLDKLLEYRRHRSLVRASAGRTLFGAGFEVLLYDLAGTDLDSSSLDTRNRRRLQ